MDGSHHKFNGKDEWCLITAIDDATSNILIFADTPEAKGRIEKTFRTIQDRLIPELCLKGIIDLVVANEYLDKNFLSDYWNKDKTFKPLENDSAYTPLDPWLDIHQILCVEDSRVIGRDQTISWQGKRYVVSDGSHSLANYFAVFRTNLLGKTRAFVLDRSDHRTTAQNPAFK